MSLARRRRRQESGDFSQIRLASRKAAPQPGPAAPRKATPRTRAFDRSRAPSERLKRDKMLYWENRREAIIVSHLRSEPKPRYERAGSLCPARRLPSLPFDGGEQTCPPERAGKPGLFAGYFTSP